MISSAETPQLHLLAVLDILGVAIAPFYGNVRISVSVDEDVESAIAVELWEEGYGGGDLSEYGLNLGLDFLFAFLSGGLVIFTVARGQSLKGREIGGIRAITSVQRFLCPWALGRRSSWWFC